jgi:hypothetical protein
LIVRELVTGEPAGAGGVRQASGSELGLLGTLVQGRVVDVFYWGVWLDLGLSCPGFIDALYIDDDDHYVVGDKVTGYLRAEAGQREASGQGLWSECRSSDAGRSFAGPLRDGMTHVA